MSSGKRKVVIAVAVLATVQVAAVLAYRAVTGTRADAAAFDVETLAPNRPAPDLAFERPDGSRFALVDLRGRPVLVHFWATWCGPCVDELPALLDTARRFAPRGLTLVAVSVDDDWDAVRRFFAGKIPADVVRAVDPDAHRRYEVISLPDTYLLTPEGMLDLRYGGARDWRSDGALAHLERVVAGQRKENGSHGR